jgi:NADPH-dependent 2,4-dienoyl-CoA reductase/sulfur reductase-like enzyme
MVCAIDGGKAMTRRSFLRRAGALGLLGVPAVSRAAAQAAPHVVVVGGGFGGATAAKYLRLFSRGAIRVTLVEQAARFVSSPMSNLVLEGRLGMSDITMPYTALHARYGVDVVRGRAIGVDAPGRRVLLEQGASLRYDRAVVSPGISYMWDSIPGMARPGARQRMPAAWRAGPETAGLRRQLAAMPDGGRFIIAVPLAPYRCPPAPYERACLVADYFKKHKPRSTVHVFDANADVTSEAAAFKAAWKTHYPGIVDYMPQYRAVDVDAANGTVVFEFGEEETADVVNVIPPMCAGRVALDSGLVTANGRWCEVDFLTFESIAVPGVHVLGDAIQIAPVMPKSGHMANQHGKTCAAAITALLTQKPVNPEPIYSNTCFSFVTARQAMHVSTVHRYSPERHTMLTVPGAGGVSEAPSVREGRLAMSWAHAIWADMLA